MALPCFKKALELYTLNNNEEDVAMCNYCIGRITLNKFSITEDFSAAALPYFTTAAEMFYNLKVTDSLALSLTYKGCCEINLDQLKEAEEDLESAVDNAYIRDETGEIVGRRPGIRGWIDKNCPALSKRYKTLMRYKALADKMKLFASSESAVDTTATAVPAGLACQQRPEQEPEQAPVLVSDIVVRFHPNEKPVRTMLKQYRTFSALDDAIWSTLGLVRMRRQRPRRRMAA